LEINKPLIAAVNGYAISGGFELALACDVRLCSPNARFGLQDVKWGFHACDGGLVRLPQIVGLGHAMDIILSGELIDAQHALRIGLVNDIVPATQLVEVALAKAKTWAQRAPLAQQFAKQTMRRLPNLPLQEALRAEVRSFYDLGQTEDLLEGTRAFREKRPAKFQGR
jgi:Enoyl-CoA hydratase/carnithine racemase